MIYTALKRARHASLCQPPSRFEGAGEPPKKKTILAALRRSPLVGADLNLTRSCETGRKIGL
jgi:hypothetical protein